MTHHANEKAPGVSDDSKELETNTTNDLNFATGTRHSKAIAMQVAHLVMAGHTVHQLKDGGYLVCKYGYTHHAPDFEALQSFARRLGVKQ